MNHPRPLCQDRTFSAAIMTAAVISIASPPRSIAAEGKGNNVITFSPVCFCSRGSTIWYVFRAVLPIRRTQDETIPFHTATSHSTVSVTREILEVGTVN